MTEAAAYAEFDDGAYAKLRRSLIRKSPKGPDDQRTFLLAVRESDRFLEYMQNRVGLQKGAELLLADRMSEAEFANPPPDTEQRLFDAWSSLTPRFACRTAFWGRVTYRHIEAGRIESSFLAANGAGVSGAQRVDAALAATGEKTVSLLDQCVRTVLRRLGGLPEARGNRSLYVNCPLARAWWRERLVREVVAGDASLARAVRAVVHPKAQQYWEELVMFVVSRNSVFGSAEVRNVLIRILARILDKEPASGLQTADKLKIFCRSVSSIQASIELSVLPSADVHAMMEDIAKQIASE